MSVEWPTVALAIVVWGAHLAVWRWHDAMPWPVTVLVFALLGGWYMSLQHETIHGHPTPWRWLNTSIAWMPLSLWLPYATYRRSHLDHHDADLTEPGVDPESFYVSPETWAAAGRLRRTALRINRTLVGRLVLGPWLGIPATIVGDVRAMRHDRSVRIAWLLTVPASVVVGWVVFGVFDVPVWQYLIGYVWGGVSVSYLRSFAEHLAVPEPATRSAMVRSNPVMSLLFLNVNHHHTHHALPGVPWYLVPRYSRDLGAEEIAAAGAGTYRGYMEIARRHAFRSFSQPVHPLAERVSR